ncbi:diguanylate cyclase (GGDEF) domain-containing protein [Lachnospiraceae bacterium]|nr:diguanylate cyclase (GGDEF) domain-containing protein [Lachnospiraceae bacterium]
MGKRGFTCADFSEKFIDNILSVMPGGFVICRADWNDDKILFANQEILDIFECSNEKEFLELTGGVIKNVVYPDDYQALRLSMKHQIDRTCDASEHLHYRIISKSGKIKYIESYGKYYDNPKEGPLLYLFVTVAEIKVDELTHLPRRRYFWHLATAKSEELSKEEKETVILAFNLVGMKGYNGKYGINEGDNLLLGFANILANNFDRNCVSRFGEDHFYAISVKEEAEERSRNLIEELRSFNGGKTLPVRIGIADFKEKVSVEVTSDCAKAAADTIGNVTESALVWYSEEIEKKISRREYIIKNIDTAISEGWIEVFYQPVVRTLTRKLCGAEALARWIDPVHGMISPGDFIPILEEHGLSYKLDLYVIKRVISLQQQRLRSGEPLITVSINISRSDFEHYDPAEILVAECDSHGVRRDLICVEITETALTSDQGQIREAINRLHEAGFEVWMDDFGSGYSSLNMLKDYYFDEIKLDMVFLRNFNERSKKIMTMAVRMAKSLGIHTLAEGVETEEHVQFLKSIGCERIQGYYYGKPQPVVAMLEHINSSGITFETREAFSLYQKTGLLDLVTSKPRALFFYTGKRFELIYRNDAFINEMFETEENPDAGIDFNMNSEKSPLSYQFRNFADKVIKNGKEEVMTFVSRNRYFHFSFETVAHSKSGYMMWAGLDGTFYEEQKQFASRDRLSRNLIGVFEAIYQIDFIKQVRKIIVSSISGEAEGELRYDINGDIWDYSGREVFEGDTERWKRFANRNYLLSRIDSSGRGFFSEMFCMKKENGDYVWNEVLVLSFAEAGEETVLVCMKPAALESYENKTELVKKIIDYNYLSISDTDTLSHDIWMSLNDFGNINFFWKDMKRRFVGASKSFRDYYGFTSDSDFVGKTDEDMGWHLNDSTFREIEQKILATGEVNIGSPNVNVVDGVVHNIIASKFPVYHDNHISGLVGYFIDIKQDINDSTPYGMDLRLVDTTTGLMNAGGFLHSILALDDNYHTNGEEYMCSVISVKGYDNFLQDYGNEIGLKLIRRIADEIRSMFDMGAVIARTAGCDFMVAVRDIRYEELSEILINIEKKIGRIKEIDGFLCRLSVFYGIANGMEGDTAQKVVEIARDRQKRMLGMAENISEASDAVNNLELDQYNDYPLPYVVVKPRKNKETGEVEDMEFVFTNRVYNEMTGSKRYSLLGKGYLEIFPKTDKRWIELTARAARGEYIRGRLYDGATNHWLSFTAAPIGNTDACTVICDVIDEERKQQKEVSEGKATSDAVLEVAKSLDRELDLDELIRETLGVIGNITGSDRVVVLEDRGKIVDSIYEWCDEGVKETPKDDGIRRDVSISSIMDQIVKNENGVNLKSIEMIRVDHPHLYEVLKRRNVRWSVVMPFFDSGKRIGYLIADNYSQNPDFNIMKFMHTSAYFIFSRLRYREKVEDTISSIAVNKDSYRMSRSSELVYDITRILGRNEDINEAANEVLARLGKIFHADRTFFIEIKNNKSSCALEWCNNGIKSAHMKWQNHDNSKNMAMFYAESGDRNLFFTDDISIYKEQNNLRYNFLKKNGVESLIEAPFYRNGRLAGFLGMDNFNLNYTDEAKKVLEIAANFIGYGLVIKCLTTKFELEKVRILNAENKALVPVGDNYDRSVQDVYKEIPIPCAYFRVHMSPDGYSAEDIEYVFANDAYCTFAGRKSEELVGLKYCSEAFHDADPQWIVDAYQVVVRGKTIRSLRYSVAGKRWAEAVMAPAVIPGYCIVMLLDVDTRRKKDEDRIKMIEVLLRAAHIAGDEEDDQNAVNRILSEIGMFTKAEYCFVLETRGQYFDEKYEWHAEGVKSRILSAQNIDMKKIGMTGLIGSGIFLDEIGSRMEIRPEAKEFLTKFTCRNIILVPMEIGDEKGYLGIQNISEEKADLFMEMLQEIEGFISSRLS